MSNGEDTFCASTSMDIYNVHSPFTSPVEFACILQIVCVISLMSVFNAGIIYQYILVLWGNMFLYYTVSSGKESRARLLHGLLVCALIINYDYE